jgi:hypothetical protein
MVCSTNLFVFDYEVTVVNDYDSRKDLRQTLLDKGE